MVCALGNKGPLNSTTPHQPDSLLFTDEFAQPTGSLRASLHALWVELQDARAAQRAATQRHKAAAGQAVRRQGTNCGTLPQWQNR